MNTPSQDSQVVLEALKAAVADTLEMKRKLGQYAVIWKDGKAVFVGDDAPKEESKPIEGLTESA